MTQGVICRVYWGHRSTLPCLCCWSWMFCRIPLLVTLFHPRRSSCQVPTGSTELRTCEGNVPTADQHTLRVTRAPQVANRSLNWGNENKQQLYVFVLPVRLKGSPKCFHSVCVRPYWKHVPDLVCVAHQGNRPSAWRVKELMWCKCGLLPSSLAW